MKSVGYQNHSQKIKKLSQRQLIAGISNTISEKIVYNRLYSYCNRMNIFSNFQFGFRKTHSTSHACSLISKITESFNFKQKILGIFLDLSKTFNTIHDRILLSLQWLKSYLRNRKQQIQINNILSTKIRTITNGVSQSSIRGP